MLFSLPSAIAYGLIIYAPLGRDYCAMAAIGGITGTVAIGLVNSLFGSTRGLISTPVAPVAAVLSVFVAEMARSGLVPLSIIPVYITLVSLFTGLLQVAIGNLGGGNFIKYIPYPVVTGYLWGVSLSIISKQLPRIMGVPKEVTLWDALFHTGQWRWESLAIGLATVLALIYAPRFLRRVPPILVALIAGILVYFAVALINPLLLTANNPFVVGRIAASTNDLIINVTQRWALFGQIAFNREILRLVAVAVVSLSVLLCITTLHVCVVMDTVTFSRHDGRRELTVQGIANMVSAMFCGIPGAGALNASILNHKSGARSRLAGITVGISALLVLVLFGKLVAWLPMSALAAILVVTSVRLIDLKNFSLLRNRATILDFLVLMAVVISSICFSLIVAAAVGTGLAIFLFFRQQMQSSVIRSLARGNEVFSKKLRQAKELALLEEKGRDTIIVEIQGHLFFGTADQLVQKLYPYLRGCHYAVIDMRRIQSVDFTAARMLRQVLEKLKSSGGRMVLSSMPINLPTGQNIRQYLGRLGLEENLWLRHFGDLDSAMEWVEDELLAGASLTTVGAEQITSFVGLELFEGMTHQAVDALQQKAIIRDYEEGQTVFTTGEISDEIYIVRSGIVKIMLPLNEGKHHLVTVGRGGIFGEMAFLDHVKRSADALTASPVSLFILSKQNFLAVAEAYPDISGKFFEHLALLIATRLRQSNAEFKTYHE